MNSEIRFPQFEFTYYLCDCGQVTYYTVPLICKIGVIISSTKKGYCKDKYDM